MAGIQLSGLASGMDTQAVIAQLMALEAQPATRMSQQKKVSEAREQALKDILTRVKNLQNAAKDLKSVTTWADTQTVDSNDPTKLTAIRTGGAGPGAYSVSVQQLAASDQWSFKYTAPAANTSFTVTTSTGSQVVNLSAGTSLDAAVGIINSAPSSKVYAVNVNGRLVMSSRDTGATAAFTVSPVSPTDALDNAIHTRTAVDAKYSLDGGATWINSASNVVKNGIPGLDLTLKSVIPTTSPVTILVGNPAPDQNLIKDKVKAFVEQYNSTIDFIRSKTTEAKVKDPKTDADRAKGLLFNDSGLNGIVQRLRSAVGLTYATGNPNVDQLAEIGITTGTATAKSTAEALAGKLTLDESKLASALSTSPLDVRNLLGAGSISGVAQKFESLLDPLSKDLGDFDQLIKSADKEQKRYQDQIDTLTKRLVSKEKLLRSQFTAMETAISKSQTTSSWLSKQLR